MRPCAIVVNDCAAPPARAPIAIRTQDTRFGRRNFTLRYNELAAGLPGVLTPRELDWIEILGFLFAIDLVCERGAGDVDWSRDINAWLPVRDPDYWSPYAVSFQELFAALTADRLEIRFEPALDPALPPRQSSTPFPEHDCVALLSGGIDSFVGAAEHIKSGGRPLLLSHIGSGATNTAQRDTDQALHQWQADLVRVKLSASKSHGGQLPSREASERSRTFLFAGAACLVAASGGSGRVFLNENGIMALHLPLTAARIGSLSTRTAWPPILARIGSLASAALEVEVVVENSLAGLTKPEVVQKASDGGYDGAIASTVSCWSIGRTREHCGICPPCLMRRISCLIHGVSDVDYMVDALDDQSVLRDPRAQDNLANFVGLLDDLTEKSDLDLQFAYPELLNAAPALSLSEAIDLHRRWAVQANGLLSQHTVPPMIR